MPSYNRLAPHPFILLCIHFWVGTAPAQHFAKTFSLGSTQFKACSFQGEHFDALRMFHFPSLISAHFPIWCPYNPGLYLRLYPPVWGWSDGSPGHMGATLLNITFT